MCFCISIPSFSRFQKTAAQREEVIRIGETPRFGRVFPKPRPSAGTPKNGGFPRRSVLRGLGRMSQVAPSEFFWVNLSLVL